MPPARTHRLLEALHPVCSHDLPNQAVALQSLLQLFQWDEAERLTPQGLEYFGRLQSVSGKTFALVQYLKELVRLNRYECQRETLAFAQLAEELQAEARRAFPEHVCTWDCRWQVESAFADPRLAHQGVMHLLRGIVTGNRPATTLRMQTTMQDEQVRWTIEAVGSTSTGPTPARTDAHSLAERLELSLAQETLAATDIAFHPAANATPGVTAFLLVFPGRTAHG